MITRLITNILSNLKVTINRIHIRYEDTTSSIDKPFSFGVILESLDLYSTPTVSIEENIKKMFEKVIKIVNLGAYFNTNNKFFVRTENSKIFKEDMSKVFDYHSDLFIPKYYINI